MLVKTSDQSYETLSLITIEKYVLGEGENKDEYIINYYVSKEMGYVYCEAILNDEVIHDYRTTYRGYDSFQCSRIIQEVKYEIDIYNTLKDHVAY